MPPEARGEGHRPSPGEPTTEKVKGIFANIAPTYDRINIVASLGIDRLWRRKFVRLAEIRGGERVLDLAAGTGDLTLAVARLGGPEEIVSTDFVPEMLDIARLKAERFQGRTLIRFETADAQDLRFEDASFDAVTVGFGVRNLPDRAANFAHVLRVLRPGGRYAILEFSRPPFAPLRWSYHFYLRVFVPMLGALLARDRASYEYLNDSIRAFPDQQALAAELRAAGFEQVEWRNLTGGIVAVHIARKAH